MEENVTSYKFLLVCPLETKEQSKIEFAEEYSEFRTHLESRKSFNSREFDINNIREISLKNFPDFEEIEFVKRIKIVKSFQITFRARTQIIIIVDADVLVNHEDFNVEQLEKYLTAVAQTAIHHGEIDGLVKWVSRVLCTSDNLPALPDWLAENKEIYEIPTQKGKSVFTVCWGNSEIRNWDYLSEDEQLSVIQGMAVAQDIWIDFSNLENESSAILKYLTIFSSQSSKRALLQKALDDSSNLAPKLAYHHLLYDDLFINFQGISRRVAIRSLKVWHYEGMINRLDKQVVDVNNIVNATVQQVNSKQQNALNSFLAFIGALSLVGLILSILQVAFIGTATVPGTHSVFGILNWFRNTNSDYIIVTAIIITVAIVYVLTRRKY